MFEKTQMKNECGWCGLAPKGSSEWVATAPNIVRSLKMAANGSPRRSQSATRKKSVSDGKVSSKSHHIESIHANSLRVGPLHASTAPVIIFFNIFSIFINI